MKQNKKNPLRKFFGRAYYELYQKHRLSKGNRILSFQDFKSQEIFLSHLTTLQNQSKVISLEALVRRQCPIDNTVCITFDGGSASSVQAAYLCIEKELPFTMYITTDLVDNQGYINKTNLTQLAQHHLCTIGSHSKSIIKLGESSPDKAVNDIEYSKKYLEDLLSKEVEHFSFPYGSYTIDTLKTVCKLFKSAATIEIGINNHRNFDAYRLKRTSIVEQDPPEEFAKTLAGFYDYLGIRDYF